MILVALKKAGSAICVDSSFKP